MTCKLTKLTFFVIAYILFAGIIIIPSFLFYCEEDTIKSIFSRSGIGSRESSYIMNISPETKRIPDKLIEGLSKASYGKKNALAQEDKAPAPQPVGLAGSLININKVRDYQIFYGTLTSAIVNDMAANYQLVILDSLYTKPAYIEYLKSRGVLVYGYISVADIDTSDTTFVNKLKEDDYLKINGQKVFSGWNYMGDIRQPHYRDLLMQNIEARIVDKGFDGVFLDTVEYYEETGFTGDRATADKLTLECISFMRQIKETWPGLSLFQNRGFVMLDKGSKEYIDAILYENFDASSQSDYYKNVESLITTSKVQCFAHTFENGEIQKTTALSLGWKFLMTDKNDNYTKYRLKTD